MDRGSAIASSNRRRLPSSERELSNQYRSSMKVSIASPWSATPERGVILGTDVPAEGRSTTASWDIRECEPRRPVS